MMRRLAVTLLIAVLLSTPLATCKPVNTVVIRVAYYPGLFSKFLASDPIFEVFNYSWETNSTVYRFELFVLDKFEMRGIGSKRLSTKNFDVLLVGSNAKSYLLDSRDPLWRNNVKRFVLSGGGYVGICGGAVLASLGYKTANSLFERYINRYTLKLIDVYINDDFDEEWQYLLKLSYSERLSDVFGIPVPVNIVNEELMGMKGKRIIIWCGGPGIYIKNSTKQSILPLMRYEREISDIAPIHRILVKKDFRIAIGKIKTDLNGSLAGVSTQNGGRIVLFGPHPEFSPVEGGKVKEFLGLSSIFGVRIVYRWIGGERKNPEYNWWMIRRVVAWAAGIDIRDLPPVTD